MRIPRRDIVGILGVVIAIAFGAMAADYYRFLHTPLDPDAEAWRTYVIEQGMSVRAIADELAAAGLVDRPLYFRVTARLRDAARRIKAGEYVIRSSMTPAELLEKFVAGDVKTYSITIIEGWTFAQMMAAIRNHDAIRQTLKGMSPNEIMEHLGHGDRHFEGLFYPSTYRFPRGATDVSLLQRSYQRMQRVLEDEWTARTEGLPLDTPYEALILASIVERETGLPDERARVAGVFIERLERGMRLQTDPTVIYGLGDAFDGDLTFKHLRTDTPYNTYTRGGLTPTPIALPSQASIHAVLHPDRRGELYFVATGDGGHVFSKTLREHREAVAKYQLSGN